MQRWTFYALIAALLWGSNAVLAKLAVSKEYYGLEGSRANLFLALGVMVTLLLNDRLTPLPFSVSQLPAYAISFAVGVIWALGNVFAFKAIKAGGTMSQLVPLWNTNTLVAVLLCIVLLREVPAGAQMIKVIIGAILITVGAILVS